MKLKISINSTPLIIVFAAFFAAFSTVYAFHPYAPMLVVPEDQGISSPGLNTAFPILSPSGKHIAFTELRRDNVWELVVKSIEGEEIMRVSDISLGPAYAFRWSHEGDMITCCTRVGRGSAVKILNIKTRRVEEIFNSVLNLDQATFFPRGRHISVKAFSTKGVDEHLLLIERTTGTARRITGPYPFMLSIDISSSGDVVFNALRNNMAEQSGGQDVYLLKAGSIGVSEPVNISITTGIDEFFPRFSPAGHRIAVYAKEKGHITVSIWNGKKWESLPAPQGPGISMTTHQGFAIMPTWANNGIIFAVDEHMRPLWYTDKTGAIPLQIGKEQPPRKQNSFNASNKLFAFQADLDNAGTTFVRIAELDRMIPAPGKLTHKGSSPLGTGQIVELEVSEDSGIDFAQLTVTIIRPGRTPWSAALTPDTIINKHTDLWSMLFTVPDAQHGDTLSWIIEGRDKAFISFKTSGELILKNSSSALNAPNENHSALRNASNQTKPKPGTAGSEDYKAPLSLSATEFTLIRPQDFSSINASGELIVTVMAPPLGRKIYVNISEQGSSREPRRYTLRQEGDIYEGRIKIDDISSSVVTLNLSFTTVDEKNIIIKNKFGSETKSFTTAVTRDRRP